MREEIAEYSAAVAIIVDPSETQVLLGTAITDDERDGKLCFPGGRIQPPESVIHAAIRETREELGIEVIPVSRDFIFAAPDVKSGVGFVLCYADPVDIEVHVNHEFKDAGWYPLNDLPKNVMELNRDLLKMIYPLETFEEKLELIRSGHPLASIINEEFIKLTYDQVNDIINLLKRNLNKFNSRDAAYDAIAEYAHKKWGISLDFVDHLTVGQRATIDKFIPQTLNV